MNIEEIELKIKKLKELSTEAMSLYNDMCREERKLLCQKLLEDDSLEVGDRVKFIDNFTYNNVGTCFKGKIVSISFDTNHENYVYSIEDTAKRIHPYVYSENVKLIKKCS